MRVADMDVKEMEVNEFINKNTGLVHMVCNRYMPYIKSISYVSGAEYDDLYQIGCMGLLKAREKFDASFGTKFSTYAVPMILGEVRRFLRDANLMKTSRWLKEAHSKFLRFELLDEEDDNVVAEKIGIRVDQVEEVRNYNPIYRSMSERVFNGGESDSDITLEDTLQYGDRDLVEEIANSEVIHSFFNTLSEREVKVWHLYYKEDVPQREVGKRVGISQVQVSRILDKIEQKANRYGRSQGYIH